MNYSNKIDLYSKSLEFFEFINGVNTSRLSDVEKNALSFYMMYGYNRETIDMISEASSINNKYIRTINNNLRKKGYLEKDDRNKHKSHITEKVKELKEYVDSSGPKLFTILMIGAK